MNVLVGPLPESVLVNGVEHKLRTDYRNALRVILAFEDSDVTPEEKGAIMLDNIFEEIPEDVNEAVRLASRFLDGTLEENEKMPKEDGLRLYSFAHDGNYIFSAFKQTHGIDLDTAQLHWWKFIALFMDLGQDTTFCNLISMRKRIKTGKASKEEQKEYRENRELYDLPEIDNRSLEERIKEEEFMRLVRSGRSANASPEV